MFDSGRDGARHREEVPGSWYSPVEGGFMQFARSVAHTALQAPIDGIEQVINHTFNLDLPPLDIVEAPAKSTFWTKAGSIVGAGIDVVLLSKLTGSLVPQFGVTSNLGNSMLRAGLTGGAYAALMPVEENDRYFHNDQWQQDFWTAKAKNIAVTAGTFATMGGAAQALGASGWLGTTGLRTFWQDVSLGALSGAPAGIVNAELSSLLDGKGPASIGDVASQATSYAAFGAVFSGINHGLDQFNQFAQKQTSDTYFDRNGRLAKVTDASGRPVELKYDDAGNLVQYKMKFGIEDFDEVYERTTGADGKPAFTFRTKALPILGDSPQPKPEPWAGSFKLDADGKGVTFEAPQVTMHSIAEGKGTWTQSPDQLATWEKMKADFKTQSRGSGSGQRPLGVPFMVPRF